ncbi:hypothetical protein GCC33_08640 [Salmonella enterica]|nr:hypothetical protein [Salmonella enterica]
MDIFINKISQDSFYSLVALLFFFFYLAFELIYISARNAFSMNSEPLTKQALFWSSIRIPFISFIYFGLFSWANYKFQFNQEGFNNFISISKLPLGLLSLCIPFVAIVNNIHRTIQTDEQIQQTKLKNRTDLFYSHQKNYIEYFNTSIKKNVYIIETMESPHSIVTKKVVESEIEIKIIAPFKLYKKIFNKASTYDNDFSISTTLINSLKSLWRGIDALIDELRYTVHEPDCFEIIYKIESAMTSISSNLQFSPIITKYSFIIDTNSFYFCSRFENEENLKRVLKAYFLLTQDILDTIDLKAYGYIVPDAVVQYSYMSEYIFPEWNSWTVKKSSSRISSFIRRAS